jgi:hypothetical protein
MPSSPSNIFKCLIVFGLLFGFRTVDAQNKYEQISASIDSLAELGLPKSALKEVDKLDELARKSGNAPQQIRAAIYRMTFLSYLQESALISITRRLKTDADHANYPAKPVLYSLLAQMYWTYYQENRYRFGQRSRLTKPDTDFTKWDLQTIITETGRLYDLSLRDAPKEQNTPISVLDGVLEGDSRTRYLRPTLYDLLVHRAFEFFLGEEAGLTKPRLPFSLSDARFFSDSRTFAGLVINTSDTASTEYKGIRYLQQASAFHQKNANEEALADIDLRRLKFLFGRSALPHKDSLYLSAIKQIAVSFSAKPISSEALVLEGQYYQSIDSLVLAHRLFSQAVAAYPESLGGKNAASLIKQMEEPELSAVVESCNVPAKPILAALNYNNLSKAKIAVYCLSESQLWNYTTGGGSYPSSHETAMFRLGILQRLTPVQTKNIGLPNTADYRKHSLEFELAALPPGNYVLKLTDTALADSSLMGLSTFKVTTLAYDARITPAGTLEVLAMDRESGKPLKHVQVNLAAKLYKQNKTSYQNVWSHIDTAGFSDDGGFFRVKTLWEASDIAIDLSVKGDTLISTPQYINNARYDALNDVADDKTILFTDRQIYRPGQTIYFKGIQLQTFHAKNKIQPGKAVTVDFLDANDQQLSSLTLTTNEFGTFSGAFVIPQTTLAGDLTLKTEDGQAEIKVEEYKRPSFQVEFSPVRDIYKPNDSVTVKGNVTAFSGYGLAQARVAYHIVRKPGPMIATAACRNTAPDAITIMIPLKSQQIRAPPTTRVDLSSGLKPSRMTKRG